jgi:hypothetical protein
VIVEDGVCQSQSNSILFKVSLHPGQIGRTLEIHRIELNKVIIVASPAQVAKLILPALVEINVFCDVPIAGRGGKDPGCREGSK